MFYNQIMENELEDIKVLIAQLYSVINEKNIQISELRKELLLQILEK